MLMPPDATTQQSLPTTEDLRTKFRTLIKLIRTVSAINHNDCPTLRKSSTRNTTQTIQPSRTLDDKLLNATATILVRDKEVVAVTVSGSRILAMEGTTEETAGEPSSPTVQEHVSVPRSNGDGNPGNFTSPIPRIAAIVNPRKEDDYKFPDGTHCTVLTNGRSHFGTIIQDDSKAWESFLRIPTDDPLLNHISTVVDYLKKHKDVPQHLRSPHQRYFSMYLVARCWPKMHQRIDGWSSKGYIYELGRVEEACLRQAVSVTGGSSGISAERNDRELASAVVRMDRNGQLEENIMRPSGCSGWNISPLVTSFRSMKQNVSRHEDDGVYDTTTCFEFHRFLIATFLAYGKALGGLKKAYEKDVKDMNDLVQKCHHVWLCCQLLSKIASSRMIRQHLIACQELLSLPSSNKRKAYNDYTKFPMADADPSANAEDLDSAVEGIDVEGDETLDQMFLKWVRLQASYWLDLSLLSRTFGSSELAQAVPEVFLITVKHPNPQFNAKALPLEPLRDTLNDLVGHSSKHPIDINIVLSTIKKMETVVNMYEGSVHCEIALAALILEAQKLSAADIKRLGFLADLLQNADQNIIVVSKQCCPICWELLDVFRGQTSRFTVRGRHPALFPVELPVWLSQPVMHEMVTRFEQILYDEILLMMVSHEERVLPPSGQSLSNPSNGGHADPGAESDSESDADEEAVRAELVKFNNLYPSGQTRSLTTALNS